MMEIPQIGVAKDKILSYIKPDNSTRKKGGTFMGYPQTEPHWMAIKAYKEYLKYNSNHVGVFTYNQYNNNKSRNMEKEVIEMFGHLYGANEVDGYITSGGTEGNIMGIWIARNYFYSKNEVPYIIKSNLSHISFDKSCNLCKLNNIIEVEVDDSSFKIDLKILKAKLKNLINKNIKSVLIFATAGYTTTGTCDDIQSINNLLDSFNKIYGLQGYIHIDAAIGGMVYPFCFEEQLKWFTFPYVMSVTVDPHKMGYVPYSAGVFLCRRGLLDYISIKSNYSKDHVDRTLIGSRNGAAAVACWAMLKYYGFNGYKKVLQQLIRKKNYLLNNLKKNSQIDIVSDPGTNMCCVCFNKFENNILPSYLEEKYSTRSFVIKYKGRMTNCYKLYIMPHITYKVLDMFIKDIENAAYYLITKPI